MLKKLFKSALTIALAGALILSVTTLSLAASPITIQKGDQSLSVSPILVQNGRTYAPYDALFEALGASASFDDVKNIINVKSGDTQISIPLNSIKITVKTGASSYILTSRGLPIVNSNSGRIYVPIRTAAQALGYVVTWNNASQTIALMSIDDMIAKSGATYTVMDKFLAYYRGFMQKSHAVDGSFKLTVDLSSLTTALSDSGKEGTEKTEPLTVSGSATGLFDKGGEQMSVNLKTNFADVAAQLSNDSTLTDKDKALLEQLKDINFDIILNNDTGMVYLKSPLLSSLGGVSNDTWVSMKTSDTGISSATTLMPGTSGLTSFNLQSLSTGTASFRDIVADVLKSRLQYGDENLAATLSSLNEMFSDQAMVKDGDTYTVTLNSVGGAGATSGYSGSSTLKMILSFNGDTFTGVTLTSSSTTDIHFTGENRYRSTSALSFSYTAAGKGSLTVSGTVNDVTALSLSMDFTYSETDKTPARAPASGSTVISFDDLMKTIIQSGSGKASA